MRPVFLMHASLAAVVAVTSINLAGFVSAAQAKSRSAPSHVNAKPRFKPTFKRTHKPALKAGSTLNRQRFRPKVFKAQPRFIPKNPLLAKPALKPGFKHVHKPFKYIPKGSAKSPLAQQILIRKGLPVFKHANPVGPLKARLALPKAVQPKITLVKAPKAMFAPRFAPFVQRHWKKAFFWVAVAGIGYLTIPEYYYDRWLSYVDEDDPDYDRALGLLSLAALDEEEGIRRVQKPDHVAYRYTAKVAPPKPQDTTDPTLTAASEEASSCALKPFVDREWSQPYSWVQIPDVGNVTVPDATYERFIGFVSGEPPNFTNACTVLAEAAAADTVSVAEATTTN